MFTCSELKVGGDNFSPQSNSRLETLSQLLRGYLRLWRNSISTDDLEEGLLSELCEFFSNMTPKGDM